MKCLILTEGSIDEINIFYKIFEKYGLKAIKSGKIEDYDTITYANPLNDEYDVLIAQAPRNRLRDLLKLYYKENRDFDKMFSKTNNFFNGTFLVFDVDHTSNDDLSKMFSIHNDETTNGLLLVSSPCLEILSEPDRTIELKTDHLRTYKAERNVFMEKEHKTNTINYIIDHFEELSIKFLDKNYKDFKCDNIMLHPSLVINEINKNNIRTDEEVIYRYFTTVVYVILAYVFGKTKEISNYKIVREFLSLKRN